VAVDLPLSWFGQLHTRFLGPRSLGLHGLGRHRYGLRRAIRPSPARLCKDSSGRAAASLMTCIGRLTSKDYKAIALADPSLL
jgi:hypothetical protein